MDFDNMTREENYMKLIHPIPHSPSFKAGNYYRGEQTGNNEIEVYGDVILYLTFEETDKYFRE